MRTPRDRARTAVARAFTVQVERTSEKIMKMEHAGFSLDRMGDPDFRDEAIARRVRIVRVTLLRTIDEGGYAGVLSRCELPIGQT
jgi:hypothetical protein